MCVRPLGCGAGYRAPEMSWQAWGADDGTARSRVAIVGPPLLQERAQALAEVGRLRAQNLVAILHRNRGLKAPRIDAHIETLFRHAKTQGRRRQHLVEIAPRGVLHLIVRNDFADEP